MREEPEVPFKGVHAEKLHESTHLHPRYYPTLHLVLKMVPRESSPLAVRARWKRITKRVEGEAGCCCAQRGLIAKQVAATTLFTNPRTKREAVSARYSSFPIKACDLRAPAEDSAGRRSSTQNAPRSTRAYEQKQAK